MTIRFSSVVLAAGISSRMGGLHKMMLPLGDQPVIRHTVRRVLAAEPREVVVVIGFEGRAVAQAVSDLPVKLQLNLRYEEGQMTSVAAGIAALTEPTDAVMICLGDMVWLEPADYRELAQAYATLTDRSIVVPYYHGSRGNPALFAASYIPSVIAGQRNLTCRKLVDDNPNEVHAYESAHARFVMDLDTPEDYARALATFGLDKTETA